MAKIVLDANVIISAAFGGKPLEAVTMALTRHEVYLTEPVVQELMGVFLKLSKRVFTSEKSSSQIETGEFSNTMR